MPAVTGRRAGCACPRGLPTACRSRPLILLATGARPTTSAILSYGRTRRSPHRCHPLMVWHAEREAGDLPEPLYALVLATVAPGIRHIRVRRAAALAQDRRDGSKARRPCRPR